MGLDFNIRYGQITKLLKIKKNSNILEIGALPPACLSNYISKDVKYLGINKNYSNDDFRIKEIDFLKNKFDENSFTHSISTDTLEHVDKKDRQKFVDEMVRVTKHTVIVGVPNPEGEQHEKTLVTLLEASEKGKHYIKFFKEHEEFGVPSKKEVRSYFSKYKFTTEENFNLRYWIGILLSDVFDFDLDLEKITDINEKPAYRTFYIINK